jgi:HSP20 family molecular chaperone IbpA
MNNYLSVLGSPRAGQFSSDVIDELYNLLRDPFLTLGKTTFSDDKVRFNTTNKQFTCEIDLPGVKKSDMKITQEGETVYISATRKIITSGGTKEENYTRSFKFDRFKFDVASLNAKLEDGILTITLQAKHIPKNEVKEIKVS